MVKENSTIFIFIFNPTFHSEIFFCCCLSLFAVFSVFPFRIPFWIFKTLMVVWWWNGWKHKTEIYVLYIQWVNSYHTASTSTSKLASKHIVTSQLSSAMVNKVSKERTRPECERYFINIIQEFSLLLTAVCYIHRGK